MSSEECVFCRIVRGELPARVVYGDADVLAVLDTAPATPGLDRVAARARARPA